MESLWSGTSKNLGIPTFLDTSPLKVGSSVNFRLSCKVWSQVIIMCTIRWASRKLPSFWWQEKVSTWGVLWPNSKRLRSVGLFNIEGYYTQILHKYSGWGPFWKFWICNSLWKFWNFPHSSRSTDALNKSVPYIYGSKFYYTAILASQRSKITITCGILHIFH